VITDGPKSALAGAPNVAVTLEAPADGALVILGQVALERNDPRAAEGWFSWALVDAPRLGLASRGPRGHPPSAGPSRPGPRPPSERWPTPGGKELDTKYLLAALYHELGWSAEAEPLLDEVLEAAPNAFHALLLQGLVKIDLRNLDEAEPPLRTVTQRDPDSLWARLGLAVIRRTRRDLAAARPDLERLTAERPDWPLAPRPMAQGEERPGDPRRPDHGWPVRPRSDRAGTPGASGLRWRTPTRYSSRCPDRRPARSRCSDPRPSADGSVGSLESEDLLRLRRRQRGETHLPVSIGEVEQGVDISGHIVDVDRKADPQNRLARPEPCKELFVVGLDLLKVDETDDQDLAFQILGDPVRGRRPLQGPGARNVLVAYPVVGGRRGPEVREIDDRELRLLHEGLDALQILAPVQVRIAEVPGSLPRTADQLVEVRELRGCRWGS
jgi:hypothetical protein